jgi:sigma-B regulation protein RsbU (phosphoserine phosphatase)
MHNGTLTVPPSAAGNDLGEGFAEFLRLNIARLARHCGVALAVAPAGANEAARVCTTVECASPSDSVRCSDSVGRTVVLLRCQGRDAGKVFLCGGPPEVREALGRSVESAMQRFDIAASEEGLLNELSMSWEILEAVYEISSQIGTKSDELIERILNRATRIQPGLQALLWLVRDGLVSPIRGRTEHQPPPRPAGRGLVGRALADRRGWIVNGRAGVAALVADEPELTAAGSVLVAPATGKHRLRTVVLEIWAENGGEFDSRTMHLAQTLALHAAMVLENEQLQADLLERNSLLESLKIGSDIQQALLMGQAPTDSPHFRVAALTVPSQHVDGDFHDFFTYPDGSLDVLLGDVMGKGVPAALTGAAAKNQFLRSMANKLAAVPGAAIGLSDLLLDVQRHIAPRLIEMERYITLVYARFDVAARRLELLDCGHTASLHFRAAEGIVARLNGDNLPLGVVEKERFVPLRVPFAPGDLFFFYSDGVTEARKGKDELFGDERLAECVRRHAGFPPEGLIDAVRREVVAFSGSETFGDDFSCVVVAVRGSVPHCIDLDSDLGELVRLRAFLRLAYTNVAEGPPDEDSLASLALAATEVFSNLVRHGYSGREGQPIRVVAGGNPAEADLRFSHRGAAFADDEPIDLDEPRESGMGLFLIRQSVDRVEYLPPTDGWSCVRLVKRWPTGPKGDSSRENAP